MHRPIDTILSDMPPPSQPAEASAAQALPDSLRSKGCVDLSFRSRHGRFALGRTAQSGCLRVRFPKSAGLAEAPCAVLINTSGGVAGGDRLEHRIAWEEGSFATVATQAAEKVYRALAHGSAIESCLSVGRGAHAEWLPQETILFDGARLRRETKIVLAEDVTFVGVEAIILGRKAMGETVRRGSLRDRMRIWRNGRLVYADTLALEGDIAALMSRAAIGAGTSAMAVLVHASDQSASLLDPVRDALEAARGHAAASAWNGLLAVRLLAEDGETLRHDIAAALSVLCEGRPLPRVWRC